MSYSTTDAVVDTLREMPYLHVPLKQRLVNYSALARLIKPIVERKLGGSVTQEAVFVAIRRANLGKVAGGFDRKLMMDLLRSSKIFMKDNVVLVHLARLPDLPAKLCALMQKLDGLRGSRIVAIPRQEYYSIVVDQSNLKDVLALTPKKDVMSVREGCATLSISFDAEIFEDSCGALEYYAGLLAGSNISILLVYSSYTELT
ncbi:MAG: hypothetical protein V1834_01875, partial [Candidatus Micrarchaeota archaeon]